MFEKKKTAFSAAKQGKNISSMNLTNSKWRYVCLILLKRHYRNLKGMMFFLLDLKLYMYLACFYPNTVDIRITRK